MYCIWYGTHFESFIYCVKKWFYAFFLFWWQFGFLLCCFSFLWSFFCCFYSRFCFCFTRPQFFRSGFLRPGLLRSGFLRPGFISIFFGNGVSPFSLCWSWSNFLGIATFSEDKGCFFGDNLGPIFASTAGLLLFLGIVSFFLFFRWSLKCLDRKLEPWMKTKSQTMNTCSLLWQTSRIRSDRRRGNFRFLHWNIKTTPSNSILTEGPLGIYINYWLARQGASSKIKEIY